MIVAYITWSTRNFMLLPYDRGRYTCNEEIVFPSRAEAVTELTPWMERPEHVRDGSYIECYQLVEE